MRMLLLAAFLVGCPFLATPETAPPAPPGSVDLNFGGVFGGLVLDGTHDALALNERILARVHLDPAVLNPHVEDAPTEPWTLALLLDRLALGNARVLTTPPQRKYKNPTGAFQHLTFRSGVDDFAAVVTPQDGGYRVATRTSTDEESLCGADFDLELGFVVFRAALQALPGGEVAGTWNLFAMLPIDGDAIVDVTLPDPAQNRTGFCQGIAAVLEYDKRLERTGPAFRQAATAVLEQALAPLLPVPRAPAPEPEPEGDKED